MGKKRNILSRLNTVNCDAVSVEIPVISSIIDCTVLWTFPFSKAIDITDIYNEVI